MARRAVTGDAEHLLDAGPTELLLKELIQRGRTFQRSFFTTTMSFVVARKGLTISLSFTLCVGGKRPPFPR